MKFSINGESVEVLDGPPTNVAELIDAAERAARSAESVVVVGVEIDGQALSGDDLANAAQIEIDPSQKIAVDCRTMGALARSVLQQGADYTGQVTDALDKVVDYYRTSRSDLAHDLLVNVTDSLGVLTGITTSVATALPEAAACLGKEQGEISPWLEEMIQAQADEDPIRLADLLEYEIRPRIENWGVTMRSLSA